MIPNDDVVMKTKEEILERLRELIQRSRKRYIKNHTKPKGNNCAYVIYDEEADQYRCTRCGTTDPDRCLNQEMFKPKREREELVKDFAIEIKTPQIMLREYRDIAAILWCLGYFSQSGDPEPVISIEKREIPDNLEGE